MRTLTGATFAPPIPQAKRWLEGVTFPRDRPLINLSQAAPAEPPVPALRAAMADALAEPDTHLYGPDLGDPALRAAFAAHWGALYGGTVTSEHVAITSGCNHAFAAAISAICGPGDAVILPVPWYFNQKMWLDMAGIDAVPLPCGPGLVPRAEDAARLIGPRTRAIVLVTPNNPTGVAYPPDVVQAFCALARDAGIRLILDETYRDFRADPGPPHGLLTREDWPDTVIQLYSFSKAYRLTGHRVGAMVADPALLPEVEKFVDTVTICPSRLGQRAALWGIANLGPWLDGQRAEFLARGEAVAAGVARLEAKGWRLRGAGAYFAWIEHPFAESAETLAARLVRDAGLLMLPATMFLPPDDPTGARHLRMAFANTDRAGIAAVFDRLDALDWPLAARPAGG